MYLFGQKVLGAAAPKPPLLRLVYFILSTDAITIHIWCNIQTQGHLERVSAKVQTSQDFYAPCLFSVAFQYIFLSVKIE